MSSGRFDVAVVGGGLAGRSAALAVAKLGLNTVHLAPAGPPDRRTSALMQPSVSYLQQLGVVADPPDFGEPLRQIRIIDATARLLRAPETLFDSAEAGLDAFGWNFANVALAERCETLAGRLDTLTTIASAAARIDIGAASTTLTLSDGRIRSRASRFVVGADGKASMVRAAAGVAVREHAFKEAALVADLELDRPAQRPVGGVPL